MADGFRVGAVVVDLAMTTTRDLLGVERGGCRHEDCEGCMGFARPLSMSAAAKAKGLPGNPVLLKCLRCGCTSKHHARTDGLRVPLAGPLPFGDWASTGDSGRGTEPGVAAFGAGFEGCDADVAASASEPPPAAAAPATAAAAGSGEVSPSAPSASKNPSSSSPSPSKTPLAPRPGAVCWRVPRQGSQTTCLEVGDLVRLPATAAKGSAGSAQAEATQLGLIRELVEGQPPEAVVAPLLGARGDATGSAEEPRDARLPADTLELAEGGSTASEQHLDFAAVISDFASEPAFQRLIFQPGGIRPLAEALRKRKCKVCVLGGSISLQKNGYRPNFIKALERRGVEVEEIPASIGTAGCKPLALVVGERVVAKKPDLLLIEAAVNDGDELLEATPRPDVAGTLRAAEGIVRTVRRRSPGTVVVFLEMFLRDDPEASRVLKTGSEAWKESETSDAVGWYHEVGPRLHRHVCRRYGLAQINLIPAMRSLSLEQRRAWFKDDCHHNDEGGEKLGNLVARLLLWAVRQPALPSSPKKASPSSPLPLALDAHCWCNGHTQRISPGWLEPPATTRKERDLLKLGEMADWLLLGAGGCATIPFKGRAFGLMTMLGPDAPSLRVRVDDGDWRSLSLLDRWCFYWRDAVVLLCEGLADTTHTVEVVVEPTPPDHSILKRPPSCELWSHFKAEAAALGRPVQKLWLLYACAVEGDKQR